VRGANVFSISRHAWYHCKWYVCFLSGPWYIGEIISDHVGCMFVFGLYVNGHFIPGSLTFYYGLVQVSHS
jgi:hypothetical protein